MTSRSKKITTVVIIIALLSGGGILYAKHQKEKNAVEYETVTVAQTELTQTVSAAGKLESASDFELKFATSGTVKHIFVKVGDTVEANASLAQLDDAVAKARLRQAQANLAGAVATLRKMEAGSTQESIAVSQESVNYAQVAYDSALTNYNNVVSQTDREIEIATQGVANAQSQLDSAKINYQNSVETQAQLIESYSSSALNAVEQNFYIAKRSLDVINDIMNDSDTMSTFAAKNTQTGIDVKNSYVIAISHVPPTQDAINAAKANREYYQIIRALEITLPWFNEVSQALDDMFVALVNTPPHFGYPESEWEADKQSIQREQSTITTATTSVVTAKNNLVNTTASAQEVIDKSESAITDAQNALKNAQLAQSQAETSKQSKRDSAQAEVNARQAALLSARAQLALTSAKPRPVDLASQKATIAALSASVDEAKNALEETRLLAPVAGTVTDILFEKGEQVPPSATFLKMLGSDPYKISVDISEADIGKVKVGQTVSMTFDAFGPDQDFSGIVVFIDPAETVISDVIYYGVEMHLTTSAADIKPGMTVNVDIKTARKENVLAIPQRAVIYDGKEKRVKVLRNGEPQEILVVIGLQADEGVVEVVSGLQAGDNVITATKTKK